MKAWCKNRHEVIGVANGKFERICDRQTQNLRLRDPLVGSARFRDLDRNSKTSFEKNCFSAWASTVNMGLINKVDMVCLSPVGYGV